jgi:hypothetical protein
LLDEVVQARRATICEEEAPKDLEDLEKLANRANIDETSLESEEKELTMAFNILTLKYKDSRLEEGFSAHIGSHSLLIVEVILSILSLLLIYLYLMKDIRTSIVMEILNGMKFLLTLILIRFHQTLLNWWILRHFIASFYLFSPLIIILIQYPQYYPLTLPVFILFISTYLILGASLSHLIKILIAILPISIYLPLIIITEQISSRFNQNKTQNDSFLFRSNYCGDQCLYINFLDSFIWYQSTSGSSSSISISCCTRIIRAKN